jgi:hypothetical protein
LDPAPDFSEFCGLLRANSVEFVIVGAHALAFHGHPRFTGDLDILIHPTIANAERLLATIAAFGFDDVPLTPAQVIEPTRLIEMGVAPVQIHTKPAASDLSGIRLRYRPPLMNSPPTSVTRRDISGQRASPCRGSPCGVSIRMPAKQKSTGCWIRGCATARAPNMAARRGRPARRRCWPTPTAFGRVRR